MPWRNAIAVGRSYELLRVHAQPAREWQPLTGHKVAFTLAPNEVLLVEVRPASPPALPRNDNTTDFPELTISAPGT